MSERFIIAINKGEVSILDTNNEVTDENLQLFGVDFEDNEVCAHELAYELEDVVRYMNEQDKENKGDDNMDIQKLAEQLNNITDEKLFIRVGTYTGDYHVGNGEFERISGELFIKTNSDTLFRVVSHDSSIIDDFDIIGSDAIITPIKDLKEDVPISYDEVDVSNKTSLRRYFNMDDEIEEEMFECVQSIPVRFRRDALDTFCDKEDRNMWDLHIVDKAWTYFLEDIIPEMTDEEKEKYNF